MRARRQTTIDAEVEAHKVRRAAVPDLSVEEKEELANLPPKPMIEAKYSHQQDVYDESSDPVAKRRKELESREHKVVIAALDEGLWAAVAAGDLDAAKEAYGKGAHPELFFK